MSDRTTYVLKDEQNLVDYHTIITEKLKKLAKSEEDFDMRFSVYCMDIAAELNSRVIFIKDEAVFIFDSISDECVERICEQERNEEDGETD